MVSRQASLDDLFELALQQNPAEWPAMMAEVSRCNPVLYGDLRSLLERHQEAGSFLEQPPPVAAMLAQTRLSPGGVLAERFEIERLIACGGMGEVYAARDRSLQGEPVAVKLLLPHIAGAPGARRRFEEEVLLARRAVHPNLCSIYDIFHADGFTFLTMRLLDGESLASRLCGSRPLPHMEAERVEIQLIAGLAALHAAGILHRDIKPGNIIIAGSGAGLRLWITDFGLARASARGDPKMTQLAGTPGYLAPELLGGAEPSEAGDVYALGVVLHQAYAGCLPGAKAARGSLPRLPDAAWARVRQFLSPDPERRLRAFRAAQAASRPSGPPSWTRRGFLAACAASLAGAAAWKRNRLDEQVEDWLHPLPAKRFVALAAWPAVHDSKLRAMLAGLLDGVEQELSRLESLDRDFFIRAVSPGRDLLTPAALSEARESAGANLVLALTAAREPRGTAISLTVLDPVRRESMRSRTVLCGQGEEPALCERAVRTAAALLDVGRHLDERPPAGPGTTNPAALAAFEQAEVKRNELNNAGLEEAIEGYRRAVELDPKYAVAYGKLAMAYYRSFDLHRDRAALALARRNAESALLLDARSIEGHLAKALVLKESSGYEEALRTLDHGLTFDSGNPKLLQAKATLYESMNARPQAEQVYLLLLKQRPNDLYTYLSLGALYGDEGRHKKALEAFKVAGLLGPKVALVENNLAAVYLFLGDTEQAVAHAEKSLRLRRTSLALRTMAGSLRSCGRNRDALPYAAQATELGPYNPENWLELGDCQAAAHAASEKISAYRKGAQVVQEQLVEDLKNGPMWMLFGLFSALLQRRQDSKDALKKGEVYPSADLDSQLWKARALAALGFKHLALEAAARCVALGATIYQLQLMPELYALAGVNDWKRLSQSQSNLHSERI